MKRFLLVISVFTLSIAILNGCVKKTYELALITDVGTVDDESFNQGTWEGLKTFAEEYGYTYKYYQPADVSDADYLDAIELAVNNGAKVVVTPGYLFESSIYEAQTLYPDTKFILIDGVPHTPDYSTFYTAPNTLPILFNEHESGFLAGYAAVMDGFTNLGFMGGMAVPAVVKFGVGYIAGAYYAASELSVTINLNDDSYKYLDTFLANDTVVTQASGWYTTNGIDVIFAAAGGAGSSIWTAAENSSKMMIGVDVDQGSKSDTILTSAMKELGNAVYDALLTYHNNAFVGGEAIIMGAANDGIGLPIKTESWRFENFEIADYEVIFAKIVDEDIIVPIDYSSLVTFLTSIGATGYPTQNVVSPPAS